MKLASRLAIVGVGAVLAFSLAACGSQAAQEANEPEEAAEDAATVVDAAEEDGQNPIMNFIGPYVCDRASMLVEANGMDGAIVTVNWGGSAWDEAEWVIEGSFDPDTLTINYENATRTDYVYADNGDIDSEEVIYTDGSGTITFSDDGALTLTWNDEKEHVADGMVFEFTF